MEKYLLVIVIGIAAGALSRLALLRVDYRQYPGYPHGFVTHISLGFIAAALGAIAVPALIEPDYAAFTFLALAAQQFREIRSMERQTLESLEESELIQRGKDYIEGIARTFEARNYLVMATAFLTSLIVQFLGTIPGIAAGFVLVLISLLFKSGETIGNICEVVPAKLYFKDTILYVDHINIMSVGLKGRREQILRDGLAVLIKPKNDDARATIHDIGQRLAIAHTAGTILGTKKDVDLPEYTPMLRKDPDTGRIGFYIVPNEPDMKALIEAVKQTPVLESAASRPLKSKAGRYAAD
ncbi:YIEGIA family protein [Desulfotomaculum sp. 1211_IL3151]|uniref:YIEGIA family protein n=1 Tax=Desulfotomaculum sp. 1211_IL3151 TaxID=3084055 RepID=UPI002FD97D27